MQPTFSASWFRVRDLKPSLRSNVRILRQSHSSGPLWLLHDDLTGRDFFLNPVTYALVGLMDGTRSVGQIWLGVADVLKDQLPTQEAVVRLLSQLYQADALAMDAAPELSELNARAARQHKRKRNAAFRNPLSLRFPLINPDAFLTATAGWAAWVFSPFGLALWLVSVCWLFVQIGLNWPGLTNNLSDRVLGSSNIAVFLVAFCANKLVHELGHAYAVKRWGGGVYEMGVMLLILMPAPYVDASAASTFPERSRRFIVGAAGMMAELALAVPAMWVWTMSEEGLLHAMAFNTILIATVSSLVFNLNPLLRFDGYYMLCDALGLPNLGTRSTRYLQDTATKALGGTPKQTSRIKPAERLAYLVYAPLAFVYKMLVVLVIAYFLSGSFLALGLGLALWALFQAIVVPLYKAARYLLFSGEIGIARMKAWIRVAIVLLVLGAAIFWLPLPHHSLAQGVVWVPDTARIRANEPAEVVTVSTRTGAKVERGEIILETSSLWLDWKFQVQQAAVATMVIRLRQATLSPAVSGAVALQLAVEQDRLANLDKRLGDLVIRTGTSGRLLLERPSDLIGQAVQRGDLLGFVVEENRLRIRVAVPDDQADFLRNDLTGIELRLARDLTESFVNVHITSVSPGLGNVLPAPALSTLAGGPLLVDPSDPRGTVTLTRFLTMDLVVEPFDGTILLGERVHVRLTHTPKPLGLRVLHWVRQLLIGHFDW